MMTVAERDLPIALGGRGCQMGGFFSGGRGEAMKKGVGERKRGWIGTVLVRDMGDMEDQIRKVQEEKDGTGYEF